MTDFVLNALAERMGLAGLLGMQYGGDRDVYAAAGYPREIAFLDYMARYKRQDIAKRIIDLPVDDSWLHPPLIYDGPTVKEAVPDTPFVQAWAQVSMGSDDVESADGIYERGLLHDLSRLDRLCGIGRYAVLLLGFRDNKPLHTPLRRNALKGPTGLSYSSVFSEAAATVAELDEDVSSRRYGLPLSYDVVLADDRTHRVHWTRCIHVADDSVDGTLYGTPRLEAAFNRLIDLDKVVPGAGEAGWRLLVPSIVLKTQDGVRLPTGATERQAVEDQASELVHGLRRAMLAQGLDPEIISAELQDPTAIVDVMLRLISAVTGIPKRILEGSERGELASTQDERAWARTVQSRQTNFVAPVILRQVIHRLVFAGVLPAPQTGRYCIGFVPLIEPTNNENAATAKLTAEALTAAGVFIEPAAFLMTFFPTLYAAYVGDAEEGEAEEVDAAPEAEDPTDEDGGDTPKAELKKENISTRLWNILRYEGESK